MTRWFVTGTDTDVGKTWVTARLLELFHARGHSTLGLKLFASGCARDSAGELYADDAEILARASSLPIPDAVRCPYRFEPPIAPGLAAEQSGVALDFDRLLSATHSVAADIVLVEGAGGLLCPLGQRRTVADFAIQLAYPILIVARAGLGTINHTLLTVEGARRRGLLVHAVLVNDACASTRDIDIASNVEQIARYGEVPVFTNLSLFADTKPAK